MAMTEETARATIRELMNVRGHERDRLTTIHEYVEGKQRHPVSRSTQGLKQEILNFIKIARVNIMPIVIASLAESLFVDGYRGNTSGDNEEVWKVWQHNKMDSRQAGVHRAALEYGTSYVTVLPGTIPATEEETAVIRGFSPRMMATLYGEDQDWPEVAMSAIPLRKGWLYRLYDEDEVWTYRGDPNSRDSANFTFVSNDGHDLGVTPVIRFLNLQDLDYENKGEIEPLMEFQDQIDLTTFELLVAQHYGAFRQRWAIGWLAPSEEAAAKVGASRMMTFEDSPDQVKVGEFDQTDLKGYLESRESTIRQGATLSQTPVHELLGQLVNLSAEALVAAESGQRRKVTERQVSFGESWEQVLSLAAQAAGLETDAATEAEVRWRDTESRALASTVDALGKMAQMLMVPPQMLWERIPGVTQKDVERWTAEFEKQGGMAALTAMLDRQMGNNTLPAGEEEDNGAA